MVKAATAAPKNAVKSNWPMWMSSQLKRIPSIGARNEKVAKTMTSGVLRTSDT